ncbi:DUF983 domain-containing protein [Sphingomonas bacterium]|uniref:DUF983 domain-containing protein n=1 Tax=Sphingomonas bacterium TaxID=1895847 RepID=UPI003F68B5F5
MSQPPSPPPGPIAAGLNGLCPRCGARTMFAGVIRFADRCAACGLDYTSFNVGDGPAAFLTLIIGAIVAGGAIAVELIFSPPWWVHVLLWPAITLALILGSLRAAKGVLLALEVRTAAREGRIAPPR